MSGANTALIGAGGAALAAVAGGPLTDVFNELALALAIMGAGGGITRGLANRLPWREVVRGGVIGASLAFGIGALAPKALGVNVEGSTVSILAASAYLLGFLQDFVVAFLQDFAVAFLKSKRGGK
ncbi:hypothetical protein [Gemmobacter denitrificans]|uniref:Phage holin n=1 Tax=Gemmobacter denitrificans TaxID=3123040 RepID=A0ABU8BQX4_9RHOB